MKQPFRIALLAAAFVSGGALAAPQVDGIVPGPIPQAFPDGGQVLRISLD